ncbi:MAG: SDR family NAD(P)-dependent oxidoreductase [Planctomycetota bacterium]|jgi:3-hydroxy acid dehydrogenase/malonic semialdehyde reductase|nr:SDR family NAD(P)-dependent oxidoreductase [Planctomycetota bacterium]
MTSSLSGLHCVVTGGAGGIGRAVTELLLARGAKVSALGRSQDKLDALMADNKDTDLAAIACDVRSEESVQAAFASARKRFGPIAVLVNNAGVGIPTPDLATTDVSAFDAMFETNVRGSFLCGREAFADMKSGGSGHIINLVSMAGHKTNPGAPLYCASKFGQRGYNSGLADQALAAGIRVSEVSPGAVDSDYWGDREVPRQKFLQTKQVAEVVLWVLEQPAGVNIHDVRLEALAMFKK